MNLLQIREKVDELLGDKNTVEKQHQLERKNLIETEDHLSNAEEAQKICQYVAQTIQQKAHSQIAGVVSRCLETVFPYDGYGFRIRFERKRGRTEAKLLLLKDDHEIENPLDDDSGGVVDVAVLALRLSCIVLAKPSLRRFIVLDEPFKFVSEEYRENVKLLLEGLAKDFKVQFLLITHISELKIGKVIEL